MIDLVENIRYFWFSVNQSERKASIRMNLLACCLDVTMILFHLTVGTPLLSILFVFLMAIKIWSVKSILRLNRRVFEGHRLKRAKEKKKEILEKGQTI